MRNLWTLLIPAGFYGERKVVAISCSNCEDMFSLNFLQTRTENQEKSVYGALSRILNIRRKFCLLLRFLRSPPVHTHEGIRLSGSSTLPCACSSTKEREESSSEGYLTPHDPHEQGIKSRRASELDSASSRKLKTAYFDSFGSHQSRLPMTAHESFLGRKE